MKTILNIGTSDANDEGLNRKIKLHNLIVLFISSASLTYVPMHLYFKLYYLMSITASILLVSAVCFILQHKKQHLNAFTFLTFGMIILMSLISITYGLIANIHFFLLCACMTSIVFFDEKKRLQYFIFGFSLTCFFCLLLFLPYKSDISASSELMTTIITGYGYFNYVILFAFTTLFFTSFVTQNSLFQKKILTQNAILENKNIQITDSLKYAKHIQSAIMPSLSMVKQHLEDSFILYQPKDIVAGDFYWMHVKDNGEILFAVADSTGHGVPGAMVSVVCTNALNQAVNEFGLTDPGLILNKVQSLVSSAFHQTDINEVRDGMDISLCLINKYKREVKWAGANNPLWIIRENCEELEVIKPDKQSVAKTEDPKPYKTHTVQLNKGDCFYLFTDGYADQFGGSAAKKYMQKRIKKLLLSIYKRTMASQQKLIHDNLNYWMGNLEQVDDICFIGIKL